MVQADKSSYLVKPQETLRSSLTIRSAEDCRHALKSLTGNTISTTGSIETYRQKIADLFSNWMLLMSAREDRLEPV